MLHDRLVYKRCVCDFETNEGKIGISDILKPILLKQYYARLFNPIAPVKRYQWLPLRHKLACVLKLSKLSSLNLDSLLRNIILKIKQL